MALTVVTSLGARRAASLEELDDFEQELVDQYALATAGAGVTDAHVAAERSVLFAGMFRRKRTRRLG